MSVFCNSNFSKKNTENEELASVVQRQYDNMLNLIVLNKLLFTIYGMICWRITDFPEDILLTMDLLVSESRWQLQTASKHSIVHLILRLHCHLKLCQHGSAQSVISSGSVNMTKAC